MRSADGTYHLLLVSEAGWMVSLCRYDENFAARWLPKQWALAGAFNSLLDGRRFGNDVFGRELRLS